jgi:hypothetical protein
MQTRSWISSRKSFSRKSALWFLGGKKAHTLLAADKWNHYEKVVSRLYETLELRLTDEQIAAIRLPVQKRKREIAAGEPRVARELGDIDLGVVDSEPEHSRVNQWSRRKGSADRHSLSVFLVGRGGIAHPAAQNYQRESPRPTHRATCTREAKRLNLAPVKSNSKCVRRPSVLDADVYSAPGFS